MQNRATPEGSIGEGYLVKERLTYCSSYMDGIEAIFNRPARPNDNSTGAVSYITLGHMEFT